MGGSGSGGWRFQTRRRVTLEDLPSVDVRQWARAGLLQPGTLFEQPLIAAGRPIGGIGIGVLAQSKVLLLYAECATDAPLRQVSVKLAWVDCRFGGRRPWFVCPRCSRRVGKLYALGGDFKCRCCCAVPYRSQNLTHADRLLQKAAKLRHRIGVGGDDIVIARPRRMRRQTFERFRSEIAALEREAQFLALHGFLGMVGR